MPVRQRVVAAAIAVPLCVLPSATWRITQVLQDGNPCITGGIAENVYVAGLSVVSMAAALLTLALVRPWGEVVPRWVPIVGGRRIPASGATIAAYAGATLIAAIAVYALLNHAFGFVEGPLKPVPPGCEPPGGRVAILYAPLLAWAPLLAYVTRDYHRRRMRSGDRRALVEEHTPPFRAPHPERASQ
jgi:hypothetical protein